MPRDGKRGGGGCCADSGAAWCVRLRCQWNRDHVRRASGDRKCGRGGIPSHCSVVVVLSLLDSVRITSRGV